MFGGLQPTRVLGLRPDMDLLACLAGSCSGVASSALISGQLMRVAARLFSPFVVGLVEQLRQRAALRCTRVPERQPRNAISS